MECSSCGKPLKPHKRFCTFCGTPAPLRRCSNCNALHEADDLFCGDCGTRLPEAVVLAATAALQLRHLAGDLKLRRKGHDNERRFVTVLFADLVGFTAFSTRKDPEEVSQLVRDLVGIFEPEITSRGGVVDKYEGDAVLARFGAPVAHEDDAEQALMASLALHRRICELENKHVRPDGQPFRLRIGINTGEVIAGTIDPGGRDYTILGDVVNTSQRFQTAAQPGQTVVGDLTYRLTRNSFDFEPLGALELKGKPRPVQAYVLSGLKMTPGDGRGLEINADAGPRSGETNFVGRNEELEILDRHYQLASAGNGQLVVISGETGIGKSRLVRHFLQRHNAQRLVIGRAFSLTAETTHAMLGNLLTHMLGLHPSETLVQTEDTRQRLAELSRNTGLTDGFEDALEQALLADALGLPDRDNLLSRLSLSERGHTLQRTIKQLVCGLSTTAETGLKMDQPLVLLLEDMHWADRASAKALEFMATSLETYPVLMIATARPEWQAHNSWSDLAYFDQINLKALTGHERSRLLRYALHKAGLKITVDVEREIEDRTGGNPFFLEEMIYSLKENSLLEPEETTKTLLVPATVHELLLARIDRLDSSSKRMLQIGAVLGRRFPERLLRKVATQVLEMESNNLESGLQHLMKQELLLENRLAQEMEYFFKHGMMQEIAYGIMLTEKKQELHELVGVALEELYNGREDEVAGLLAFHYGRSNNPAKALHYLIKAGDRASSFNAYQDALQYYQEALKLAQPDQQETLRQRIDSMKEQVA